jgi:CheY-like chemotaxis protein
MKILLAEDDLHKREQLRAFLRLYLPSATVVEAKSFRSTVRALRGQPFGLVILDMSMPSYDITDDEDGGRHDPYAGREVLAEMDRYGIETPVIVVTQFDRFGSGERGTTLAELDAMLVAEFSMNYKGFAFFDAMSETWREALHARLIASGITGAKYD